MSNTGTGNATGNWYDQLLLSSDNQLGSDISLGKFSFSGDLGPGESYQQTKTVRLPDAIQGDRWIIVKTDIWDSICEYNAQSTAESNNILIDDQPITVHLSPYPDLLVTDIGWVPEVIHDGNQVEFTATVANAGDADVTNEFYIRFEVDGNFVGRQQVIGVISVGASVQVNQTWSARSGSQTVRVIADEYNAVSELDKSNNELSSALPTIVDITPPVITRLTPRDGADNKGCSPATGREDTSALSLTPLNLPMTVQHGPCWQLESPVMRP